MVGEGARLYIDSQWDRCVKRKAISIPPTYTGFGYSANGWLTIRLIGLFIATLIIQVPRLDTGLFSHPD